jgi:hypothetical protein
MIKNSGDIARYRLANQLISRSAKKPKDVVRQLCAMQAQDYNGALWAIGLRSSAKRDAVEKAIAEKSIVRTWPMRGTLHFVAANDVHWMLKLLTSRIIAGSRGRQQQLGLNEDLVARGEALLANALRGRQLKRDELYKILEKLSIKGQARYHVIRRAAFDGLICFGAHEGKQPTFARLDEWVAGAKRFDREAALRELAERYFASHGPAALKDFVWWSGLTVADAKRSVAAADLSNQDFGGTAYWFRDLQDAPQETAYLLPAFDEYLVGYKDRSAVLPQKHSMKIVPGGNGMFLPVVVVDGRVAGTWKRAQKKDGVAISIDPFENLGRESDAIEAAAERYGKYLGKQVVDVSTNSRQ